MRLVWVSLLAAVVSMGAVLVACEEEGTQSASKGLAPPPDAQFLEEDATPEGVMMTVARAKKTQQANAATMFRGLWVPEPGWMAPVEAVNDQRGGTTLGLKFYGASVIGGEFWVLALVPRTSEVKEGDTVAVQGKIKDVEVKSDGVTPIYRLILEDARILEHHKR